MSYDFTKLSRVPINDSVTDETYTLVVNQDEVERTPYGNTVSNIQDYTEDYNTYSLEHPGTSPVDFIRTLTPIRVDTQTVPRQGYLTYMYFYYAFEVFCSTNLTWYKITEVNTNQNKLTEYLYSPTELVEQVQKNYTASNSSSGTHFVTPVEFDNVRELNCSGNVNIDGTLNVHRESTFDSSVSARRLVASYGDNSCEVEETSILFSGANTEVMMYHDGNGNLVVTENGSNTKITGLSNPTNSSDAVNKHYVDINVAELNGRIGNLVIGGDSTEGEETVVYLTSAVAVLDGTASSSYSLYGTDAKLISVEWFIIPQSSSQPEVWRTENLTVTKSTFSQNSFSFEVTGIDMPEPPEYVYVKFRVVYSRKANLIVPELVDLRQPFNYTGTWPPAEYDPNSQGYFYGDYVTYNNVIYMCIDEQGLVSGQWDPDFWAPVTARLNIQEALNYRLRLGGQDPMLGNLDMNSHKIINVSTPTTGTDAATKAYVDNRTFSLDANGILSL